MSSSSLVEVPESLFFSFAKEPAVQIEFDSKTYVILSIKGTRVDGSKVDNTDVENPQQKIPISLKMQKDMPNMLAEQYGFKGEKKRIPPKTEPVKRFEAVVEALVDIATTDGVWGRAYTGDQDWSNNKTGKLGFYNNLIKFFYIADQVGIYSLSKKTRKKYKIKDTEEDKQAFEVAKFRQNKLVGRWLGRLYDPESKDAGGDGYVNSTPKFKDKPEDAITLWQALILLDMTPQEFLDGQKVGTGPALTNDADKIDALTARLEQKTFMAVGDQKIAFPNPMSLITWATRANVPTNTEIENPVTKKLEIVPFAQKRSTAFKAGAIDKGGSGGVQKQLTKYMRHFAESNGLTGTWSKLWAQKTPDAIHGLIDMDIHYLRDFEDCLRKGVQFNDKGEFVIFEASDKQKENKWFGSKKHKDGSDREAFDQEYDFGKYQTIKKGATYFPIKKVITTKEDWEAAWMYYRVAMDLGWRAEEGFTAGANKSLDENMTGTKEDVTPKTVSNPEGQKFVLLRIMTRKTAHVGAGHHGGSIITPETMDLIRKKREMVDEYGDPNKHTAAEALEKGVIQSYISTAVDPETINFTKDGKVTGLPATYNKSVPNKIHALVGADGYFTEVDTMDLPSNPLMTKELKALYREHNLQIPAVKGIEKNRIKLHAIMRHCYAEVFLGNGGEKKDMYDNYFKKHSLHALRHLFAQYWLKASARKNGGVRDYALVMQMGHWKGIDVLMNYYGKVSTALMTRRAMDLKADYEQLTDAETIQKKQEEEDKPLEATLDNVNEDNFAETASDETDDAGEPAANNTEEEPTDEL